MWYGVQENYKPNLLWNQDLFWSALEMTVLFLNSEISFFLELKIFSITLFIFCLSWAFSYICLEISAKRCQKPMKGIQCSSKHRTKTNEIETKLENFNFGMVIECKCPLLLRSELLENNDPSSLVTHWNKIPGFIIFDGGNNIFLLDLNLIGSQRLYNPKFATYRLRFTLHFRIFRQNYNNSNSIILL